MHPATSPIPIPIPGLPKIPNPFGGGGGIGADQVIKWIVSGITKAINSFFSGLVTDALKPLLQLLAQTLLTTPELGSLPRVGQLWENSRVIAVSCYAVLILLAGIVVMAYETLQTRHGIKEIAPRVVVGFVAANMSLLLAAKAVIFANALSLGILGNAGQAKTAASVLSALVMRAVAGGGIFLVFIGMALAVTLLAVLVGYVIRVALTVILIAGAPLALMCHALPQTEGIARWWWRAFAGVLAIQVIQSLTLVAALNVFLDKRGFSVFGPTKSGLVDLIVTIALLYILWKIPFWVWQQVQVSGRGSFLGGVVKGLIAYKTLGALGLRGGAGRSLAGGARRRGGGPSAARPPGGPGGPSGPRRPGGPSRSGGPRGPRGGPASAAARGRGAGPRRAAGGAARPRLATATARHPAAPVTADRPRGAPAAPIRAGQPQQPATTLGHKRVAASPSAIDARTRRSLPREPHSAAAATRRRIPAAAWAMPVDLPPTRFTQRITSDAGGPASRQGGRR